MDIKQFDGLNAYTQASQNLQNSLGSSGDTGAAGRIDGSSFASLIDQTITDIQGASGAAETVNAQALTGEADLVDVVTAVSNAELVVDTVVTVRDRVISAYNDILKMPI